jgi:dienelactone hydrolase
MAASRLTGFACAVAYYGGGITDAIDEQPKCPVMAHFGEQDTVIPVPSVEKLMAAALGGPSLPLSRRPWLQLRPSALLMIPRRQDSLGIARFAFSASTSAEALSSRFSRAAKIPRGF